MKDVNSDKQIEEIKREYYKENINSKIDTSFMFDSDQHKQEFLDICKYVGSILSLTEIFKQQAGIPTAMCHAKHFLFLLFILCYPLREALPCLTFFILAYATSMLQRCVWNKRKESLVSLILSDEESMLLCWILTYALIGWQLRILVDIVFFIWAVLNTCEWLDYLMMRHPGIPILSLFESLILIVQDKCVSIVLVKNYIEVTVVLLSTVSWTFSWCAPICSIVLVQAVRIKFMGSNFTKKAFRGIDSAINSVMPSLLYLITVQPLKNYLSTLSGVKESLENEK